MSNEASKLANLIKWRFLKIKEAEARGDEFFMGLPDAWYEPRPTYACKNGHISHRFLKSEKLGDVCLSCHEHLFLVPAITEEELNTIMSGEKE